MSIANPNDEELRTQSDCHTTKLASVFRKFEEDKMLPFIVKAATF